MSTQHPTSSTVVTLPSSTSPALKKPRGVRVRDISRGMGYSVLPFLMTPFVMARQGQKFLNDNTPTHDTDAASTTALHGSLKFFPALFVAGTALFSGTAASALPQDGAVVAGTATITTQTPTLMTVTQDSVRAIIDWRSFSLAPLEHLHFDQKMGAGASTLNRVTGNDASVIAGKITAPGSVFLLNANGVMFTQTASVDVGSLVATTSDIRNSDFMAGRYEFFSTGSTASVSNAGNISIKDGGLAALVAPTVTNSGVIVAHAGKVALAGGETYTLDFYGDKLVNFATPEQPSAAPVSVTHSGEIFADVGRVLLTTRDAVDIVDNIINTTGLIQARSAYQTAGGAIVLDGGAHSMVTVSGGTLDASGQHEATSGGTITITGDRVGLDSGAHLDASGTAGGGDIRVGGDVQGTGDLRQSAVTYVANNVTLDASATGVSGDAGSVVVWSDGTTVYGGDIRATAQNGAGGFAEVSGKETLQFLGTADLSSANGENGVLLLDPRNLTIKDNDGSGENAFILNAISKFLVNPTALDSVLYTETLEGLLATNHVFLTTTGTLAQPREGDIVVNGVIDADAVAANNNYLFMAAHDDIILNASIDMSGGSGNLLLDAGKRFVASTGYSDSQIIQNAGKIIMGNGGGLHLRALNGIGTAGKGFIETENLTRLAAESNTGSIRITNTGAAASTIHVTDLTTDLTFTSGLDIHNATGSEQIILTNDTGGGIEFDVALDGGMFDLTLDARSGGDVVFHNTVGSSGTPVNSLTVLGADLIHFEDNAHVRNDLDLNGNSAATSVLHADDPLHVGKNVRINQFHHLTDTLNIRRSSTGAEILTLSNITGDADILVANGAFGTVQVILPSPEGHVRVDNDLDLLEVRSTAASPDLTIDSLISNDHDSKILLSTGKNVIAAAQMFIGDNTAQIDAGNRITLTNDIISEGGDLILLDSLVLSGDTRSIVMDGGKLFVQGTINGDSHLVINSSLGDVVVLGGIGNSDPLRSLFVQDALSVLISGTVTSQGDVTLDGNGGDISSLALLGGAQSIVLGGDLTIRDFGTVLFPVNVTQNGAGHTFVAHGLHGIGGTGFRANVSGTPFAALDINARDLTGSVTINNLGDVVTLVGAGTDATLTAFDTTTQNTAVTLNSGDNRNLRTLTDLHYGQGDVTLDADTAIFLNHNITGNGGNLTLLENVLLGNDIAIATGGGDLDVVNGVREAFTLTLDTDTGNITSSGFGVSPGHELAGLNITTAQDVNITGSSAITGNVNIGSIRDMSLASGSVFSAGGDITVANARNILIDDTAFVFAHDFTQQAGTGTTNFGLTGITATGDLTVMNAVILGNVAVAGNVGVRKDALVDLTGRLLNGAFTGQTEANKVNLLGGGIQNAIRSHFNGFRIGALDFSNSGLTLFKLQNLEPSTTQDAVFSSRTIDKVIPSNDYMETKNLGTPGDVAFKQATAAETADSSRFESAGLDLINNEALALADQGQFKTFASAPSSPTQSNAEEDSNNLFLRLLKDAFSRLNGDQEQANTAPSTTTDTGA